MIRDITIHAVLNGFEVKVGCQVLVSTDVTEMLKEIRRYLKNPEKVEKEYLEKALNAKHVGPVPSGGSSPYQAPSPTAPSRNLVYGTCQGNTSDTTSWWQPLVTNPSSTGNV